MTRMNLVQKSNNDQVYHNMIPGGKPASKTQEYALPNITVKIYVCPYVATGLYVT